MQTGRAAEVTQRPQEVLRQGASEGFGAGATLGGWALARQPQGTSGPGSEQQRRGETAEAQRVEVGEEAPAGTPGLWLR